MSNSKKNVLSFPSSDTYDLVMDTHVHAHPNKTGYPKESKDFMTIRKKGGIIEKVFKVNTVIDLNPNNYMNEINHLSNENKQRLISYIERRKESYGFERENEYKYRFYVLDDYMELEPAFVQNPILRGYNYYSLNELCNKSIQYHILFCNIAYMKNYDANNYDEIPVNGGSYVTETKDAFEKYNFHVCEDGMVRGFVETKYSDGAIGGQQKPKQLHIENIDDEYKNADSIDNVLVVFGAHSPIRNKTVIIGWYKNATVYRNRERYNDRQYNIITNSRDAVLLSESNRVMEIPRASKHEDNLGFGQANVWYAKKVEHQEFVNKIIDYINETEIKISNRNIDKKNAYEDDNLNNSIKHTRFDKDYHFEYTDEMPSKPEAYETRKGVIYYRRDRKRAINALNHADYRCEYNPNHASFIRKNDGVRYTEAHHLIPMSQQDKFDVSLDIEENIVSLCSNCHNEIHYGENAKELIEKLFNQRKDLLKNKGIEIKLDKLLDYYNN